MAARCRAGGWPITDSRLGFETETWSRAEAAPLINRRRKTSRLDHLSVLQQATMRRVLSMPHPTEGSCSEGC